MATIGEKFRQLGTSIINLVGTRASRHLDNLSTSGQGKLDALKMYTTGSVLTDEQGYVQLLEMKQTATETGTDTVTIGDAQVEIPYTLSKSGSKIVDVAHRDKVTALYNQGGKAKYYTIDEVNRNFTLPMGEVYGMIGDAEKDGDEIYTGIKTFKGGLPIILQHPSATVATPPGTASNVIQDFRDTSGVRTGCIYNSITPSGDVLSQLQVIRGDVYNTLALGIDAANRSTLTHNGNLLRYVDYFFANETGWCRKWSDGWLEQGGILPEFGSYSSIVLTFLRPWLHTGYSIFVIRGGYIADGTRTDIGIISMSTANCDIGMAPGSHGGLGRWYACGWDSTAQ